MSLATATPTGQSFAAIYQVPRFVPAGVLIPFPAGTVRQIDGGTWAMYANVDLNRSWIAYSLPTGGSKILPMGGVRRVGLDQKKIGNYIEQMRAAGCSVCDEE